MPEHNELIGAQLHPPQPLTFTGAVGSYTPPSAGVLAVRTDVEPRLLYVTTGTTAGALVPFGTEGVGATIAIGSVTAEPEDVLITVNDSGTTSAAVLDFDFNFSGLPVSGSAVPLIAAPPAAPPDPLPAAGTAALALETSSPPVLWAYDGAAWSFVAMTAQSASGPLSPNLIGWYKFDNDLTDSSGNNLTLSVLGAGTPAYAASSLDNALDRAITNYAVQSTAAAYDSLHLGFYLAMVVESPFTNTTNSGREILASQLVDNNFGDPAKFQLWVDNTTAGFPGIKMELYTSTFNDIAFIDIGTLPPANTDFLLEAYFNPTAGTGGQVGLAVNNGAFVVGDLYGSPISTATAEQAPLVFAATAGAFGVENSDFNGLIEMAAIWSAPFADISPTGPERALLWNEGNFRSDP